MHEWQNHMALIYHIHLNARQNLDPIYMATFKLNYYTIT